MKKTKTRYGPRKIGAEEFAKQQADKVLRGRPSTKYGPRKGGAKKIEADTPAPDSSRAQDPSKNPFLSPKGERVPLGTLESILDDEPELFDLALETEVAAEEARKGAVELLRKLELDRDGGPRESVIQLLSKLG